jgi:hypothetical protein
MSGQDWNLRTTDYEARTSDASPVFTGVRGALNTAQCCRRPEFGEPLGSPRARHKSVRSANRTDAGSALRLSGQWQHRRSLPAERRRRDG